MAIGLGGGETVSETNPSNIQTQTFDLGTVLVHTGFGTGAGYNQIKYWPKSPLIPSGSWSGVEVRNFTAWSILHEFALRVA